MTETLGSFTGSFDWTDQPPQRCDLTFSQLCDLLRLALAGRDIPIYSNPQDILSDLHLVGMNEIRKQQGRAEYERSTGATARRASTAAWQIVYAAEKRLTVRTADLRAALEGASA